MLRREAVLERRVVEALRSGVPSRSVCQVFPMGRQAYLARFNSILEDIGSNGTGPGLYVFSGDYGEGKTHLLLAMARCAEDKNFVVSFLNLSKETPFDKLHKVYPKLVAGTNLPGSRQPGFERLLSGLKPGSHTAESVLAYVEENLHPKLYAVVRNYVEGTKVEENSRLYEDLAGLFIGMAELKAIHRLNFGVPLSIRPFRVTSDIMDYFRFLDYLFRATGHAGWVILLDEVELLGKLGRTARAKAYQNIAQLTSDAFLRHTVFVFSVASAFYTDVFDLRKDPEVLPPLVADRLGESAGAAVTRGIEVLGAQHRLAPLGEPEVDAILSEVIRIHARAYAWTPPESAKDAVKKYFSGDVRLRSKIRAAVQYLDVAYLYGKEPSLTISPLNGMDIREDQNFFEETQEL